jgi:putative ABC transport system permease protein
MGSLRFVLADLLESRVTQATVVLGLLPVVLGVACLVLKPQLFLLIVKNLGRNPMRTALTSLAVMVLVFVVVIIWTVVFGLERFTQEKETNFRLIVSEKWSVPSMLPPRFADYLNPGKSAFILDRRDVGVNDFMNWSFYEGTTKREATPTVENVTFFFVMDPDQIRPMMDELESIDEGLVRRLKENQQAILLGPERLVALSKRVGERFNVYGVDYKDSDLDVEVVANLPAGRYGKCGIMNKAYFESALDKYKAENKQAHPMAGRSLNYLWLRVPDKAAFACVAHQIETSPYLKDPEVKCETAAAAIGMFIEPYSGLLRCVEYVLVPAILSVLTLVVANAIGISMRERQQE